MKTIIVGGGIGGLTAATALRQQGHEVVVCERGSSQQKLRVGGGIHLWNNAMRVLDGLGLADPVRAVAAPLEQQEFRSWRGEVLASWPVGEMARKLGVPSVSVGRADLHRALASPLEDGVVRFSAECTGFQQSGSGVAAALADGQEERGDLLVGTDGLNSVIRTQLLGPAKPRYSGYTVYQGITFAGASLVPDGLFVILAGRGLRFAYYHIGGQRLCWFAVANAQEGGRDPEGERKSGLLQRYQGWQEPVQAVIEATDEPAITRADMYDRDPVRKWGEGRVTLLGDAAHPTTFNLGQGSCLAIEDVAALTTALAENGDAAAALRAYEARRMPRTAKMVRTARMIGDVHRWNNPLVCGVRDQLMKLLFRGPAWQDHKKTVAHHG
jgi:2-polyprenyl-6-methoxyphenol hydroxylase-like FAD-dependent oxidoreductase